jgi:hypothetical protein
MIANISPNISLNISPNKLSALISALTNYHPRQTSALTNPNAIVSPNKLNRVYLYIQIFIFDRQISDGFGHQRLDLAGAGAFGINRVMADSG